MDILGEKPDNTQLPTIRFLPTIQTMANIPPAAGGVPPAPLVPPPIPAWMVQANVLALDPDETILYELMVNFHNFTHLQYVCLCNVGGYGNLMDLNQWSHKHI